MHRLCIFVCMRTTLNINEELIEKASNLTHIKSKTALIHEGLKALITRESSQRLALLGGSEKSLKEITRRR